MNKSEIISEVAEKSDLTKKDTGKIVDAVFESITDALSKGEKVQLIGFGSFDLRKRKEREGRNPATGDVITIPEANVPVFKPGKKLKENGR